jgi:puromycin-sensitive aminopeptidase
MSRLPSHVRPERYRLDLHVDPERDRYRGTVEIDLELARRSAEIPVHAADLQILEARALDAAGTWRPAKVVERPKQEQVLVRAPRGFAAGRASLRIVFEGALRTDLRGLYLARSGNRRYAVTQLEPADARRFFPCLDEPDRKARFRLSVTTAATNEVISNAPVEKSETRGAEKTVHFAETEKLSTYLVALIVGELVGSPVRRAGKTPIRVWHVPEKRGLSDFALEAAAAALDRLERYFALPYPYAKLDLIAVPDFEFGAMENAGAVTFRETLLLMDPKTVTLEEKKRVAEVIAHELAHMWYGDLVTMAWWDDLWLNEAFATWMAFTVVDQWKPEWKLWLDFEHHRTAAFGLDALRNTHPIYVDVPTPAQAMENFDLITYEKGASVVRMIERWLGPTVFRAGVRRYIRRHRESNARAADLWGALEEAARRPVAKVVRAWIERPGFPVVAVRRTAKGGRARIELQQERYFASPRGLAAERRTRWPIPLVLRVHRARGADKLERRLFAAAKESVELGRAADVRWVYANAEESGFFRPLHDAELLAAITADLAKLPAVERIGLVSHQWAGVRASRAPLGDFLGLVAALGGEPEFEVIEATIAPLAIADDHLAPAAGAETEAAFHRFVAGTFAPAFRALGWKAAKREADDRRLLRAALLRLVGGIAEDQAIVREAQLELEAFLRDRASLDPNLAGTVVELGARTGDKARYERYLEAARGARTPQERNRFQQALGSFRDPALVERTLELSLAEEISTQDVVPLYGRLLANRHGREATWRFIRARWPDVSRRVPGGLMSRLIGALPQLQTREARREVADFFRAHPQPTAARALKQALERFDLDAELRRRCAPALRKWLAARER